MAAEKCGQPSMALFLFQEMLSKARAGDTGVKLEVNER